MLIIFATVDCRGPLFHNCIEIKASLAIIRLFHSASAGMRLSKPFIEGPFEKLSRPPGLKQ
jgi:hypothetical protein